MYCISEARTSDDCNPCDFGQVRPPLRLGAPHGLVLAGRPNSELEEETKAAKATIGRRGTVGPLKRGGGTFFERWQPMKAGDGDPNDGRDRQPNFSHQDWSGSRPEVDREWELPAMPRRQRKNLI
jgi:hypothetical protein